MTQHVQMKTTHMESAVSVCLGVSLRRVYDCGCPLAGELFITEVIQISAPFFWLFPVFSSVLSCISFCTECLWLGLQLMSIFLNKLNLSSQSVLWNTFFLPPAHTFLLILMISSSCREVSEPSAAAVTEVEAESESPMAQQPPSGTEPEKSEGHLEEVRSLRGWGCSDLCSLPLTCIFTHISMFSWQNK